MTSEKKCEKCGMKSCIGCDHDAFHEPTVGENYSHYSHVHCFDEKEPPCGKKAHVQLRHGYFTVYYPDVNGEEIYEARPKGDGIFENDERDFFLEKARDAIMARIKSENPNTGTDNFKEENYHTTL